MLYKELNFLSRIDSFCNQLYWSSEVESFEISWCKISQIGYIYKHCQELNRVWRKNGFNHQNGGGGELTIIIIIVNWNSKRMGDNPFCKFWGQGEVKIWKPSLVWYGYFLELPISYREVINVTLTMVTAMRASQKQ